MPHIDVWEAAGPRERARLMQIERQREAARKMPRLRCGHAVGTTDTGCGPQCCYCGAPASVTAVTHSNPSDL